MQMLQSLWAYRGFIHSSVRRDFHARYRNSLLGAAWAILNPLALIAGGAALDSAVDRILAAFPDRPHIFNLGHGVVPETPPEHVAALVARVRVPR